MRSPLNRVPTEPGPSLGGASSRTGPIRETHASQSNACRMAGWAGLVTTAASGGTGPVQDDQTRCIHSILSYILE